MTKRHPTIVRDRQNAFRGGDNLDNAMTNLECIRCPPRLHFEGSREGGSSIVQFPLLGQPLSFVQFSSYGPIGAHLKAKLRAHGASCIDQGTNIRKHVHAMFASHQ